MALRQSPVVGREQFLAKAEGAFGERFGIRWPALRIGCECLQHERIGKQARVDALVRVRYRRGTAGCLLSTRERPERHAGLGETKLGGEQDPWIEPGRLLLGGDRAGEHCKRLLKPLFPKIDLGEKAQRGCQLRRGRAEAPFPDG
jgi:hypothetical protein